MKIEVLRTILFTTISSVGSGLLMMPKNFLEAKAIPFALYICLMAVITGFSLFFIGKALIYLKENNQKVDNSFGSMALCFSRNFKNLVDFCLILSNGASSFMFFLTFSNHLFTIIKEVSQKEVDYYVKIILVSIAALLVCYLIMQEDLSFLDNLFYINIATAFIYLFSITYYSYMYPSNREIEYFPNKVSDCFSCIGKFIFAMHCQYAFPSIIGNIPDLNTSDLTLISIGSPILSAIVYGMGGFFGYLTFDDKTPKLFGTFYLLSSDSNIYKRIVDGGGYPKLRLVAPLGFTLLFILVIPIMLSSVIPVLINTLGLPTKRGRFYLALSFSLGYVLCVITKINPEIICDVVGAIFTNALSFLIPGLFGYLTVTSNLKYFSYFLMAFSLLVMCKLIYDQFLSLIK